MAEPIKVRKLEHVTRVNIDAEGKPMCNCCAETMVEIKPGTWMCALGAAALTYLASHWEPEPHLGHALGGPSPEPGRG